MKLRVDSLFWGTRERDIVSGVTLSVREGELVGVIGPNGSGKSSLLRCVYRMNRPRRGIVLLDGRDVWEMGAREAALRSAAVPQEMPSQFDFTVREIAAMGRYPHKGMMERDTERDGRLVTQALEYVGMLACADRAFSSLSGGEKQRALIARAIAQGTDLLILDEPTNHLDIYYQLEIMDLIKNLGIACLVVMHDLNLAARYCDRIYVMRQGKIFASGRPGDILTPELIRDVYHVRASVTLQRENHLPQILFLGIEGSRTPPLS
ncbi:MAG: ABC transporter ATP-binding protein [Fretibacterium sp.]|nr:ABC transporter ATP-binding protein [Fretibacterium sp.]